MELKTTTNPWEIKCQECYRTIKTDEEYIHIEFCKTMITTCKACACKLSIKLGNELLGGK